MKIISHRGYWKNPNEKNAVVAFQRSFDLGFGTETDIRDSNGRLVISHDMPTGSEITVEAFFDILAGRPLTLALNIKADGLAKKLQAILEIYRPKDAFVFDMSVPDLIQQLKTGIPSMTRLSEYEQEPSCYEDANGIWLDAYHGIWYNFDLVKRLMGDGKRVCFVSPELHGRPKEELWSILKTYKAVQYPELVLCTDVPEEAQKFFA